MLAKTVKLATAWREANSSRDNRNITASTAEGRSITIRVQKIDRDQPTTVQASAGTPTAHYGRQQHNMDANSSLWTPTAQYRRQQLMSFRGNSP
jgi:hypothetical protein